MGLALKDVLIHCTTVCGVGCPDTSLPSAGIQAVFTHTSGSFLAAYPFPVHLHMFCAYPGATITPMMPCYDFLDKLEQFLIGGCMLLPLDYRLLCLLPLVLGATAYSTYSGHLLDAVSVLGCLHELIEHHCSSPRAKMTAAFLRISLACLSDLFSLRRRASSASGGRP